MYLFVYGTLMHAANNPFAAYLRAHSSFVSNGYFSGELYRISWYPGALSLPDSDCKVYGEIFKIDKADEVFQRLDEYEGAEYTRQKIMITTVQKQEKLPCQVYLYTADLKGKSLIPSGRFLQ